MGDILTSLSILIVLVTFGIGYLERRGHNRRRRTLEFLRAVIENDGPIQRANLELASWMGRGKTITCDDISTDEDLTIITLPDYYDLVADTAVRSVVDREMIVRHLGGRMATAYDMLEAYINCRRRRLNRPDLYRGFESFVRTYTRTGGSPH